MNQMQAFIEKTKNKSELIAKTYALGASGAEPDKVIDLAAEYGFPITIEDYRMASKMAGEQKTEGPVAEDLVAEAGEPTENYYDRKRCSQIDRVSFVCCGFLGAVWCEHYSYVRRCENDIVYESHKCAKGRFDYVGDGSLDRLNCEKFRS